MPCTLRCIYVCMREEPCVEIEVEHPQNHAPAMCGTSGSGAVPGNLLRFDATIKLSSAVNRTLFAQDAVKGIVMGEAANRTSYQPIDITQLPYSAKPPVGAHSTSAYLGAAWVCGRCVHRFKLFVCVTRT